MSEVERCDVNPGIAGQDQSHAEALDALRTAEDYVLVVRAPDQGPEYARVLSAGTVEFIVGAAAAAEGMAREAYHEALKHAIREAIDDG